MGNGIFISILYHPIWRTEMLETHRNINKNDGRLKECLRICIDSLSWIGDNGSLKNPDRDRPRATLQEIKRILHK